MARGVIVTRDEGPDGPLTGMLRDRGCVVHHWPTIRTAPPEDPSPLAAALSDLSSFDWVVFTSPRAVGAVVRSESAPPVPPGIRVAAVGRSTAEALRDASWSVDLVPEPQTGEALVEALLDAGMDTGTRVLFPASAIALDTVPDGLEEAGVVVIQVEAYRTEPAALDRVACRAALDSGRVSVITFTSPSTVENLEAALGRELFAEVRGRTTAVAIGPTTGDAAERAGFEVLVAEPHSLEGLAERVATLAAVNG